MTVRIRMKKLGRKHRPFYRICAMEQRTQRDGRILEELGTYDPMVPETDARAKLDGERIKYWLSVGAQPSDKVKVLIKKYGSEGTHLEQQRLAIARLAEMPPTAGPGRCRRPGGPPAAEQPPRRNAEAADNGDTATAAATARPRKRPHDRARTMRFDVLTLFPEIFPGYLGQSLSEAGHRRRPGGGAPAQHPPLGAGKHIGKSTIAPSAAGRAW